MSRATYHGLGVRLGPHSVNVPMPMNEVYEVYSEQNTLRSWNLALFADRTTLGDEREPALMLIYRRGDRMIASDQQIRFIRRSDHSRFQRHHLRIQRADIR